MDATQDIGVHSVFWDGRNDGANAFNGIIHITTKKPSDEAFSNFVFHIGNQNQIFTDAVVSGKRNQFSYKVSIVMEKVNQWRDNPIDVDSFATTILHEMLEENFVQPIQDAADENGILFEEMFQQLYPGQNFSDLYNAMFEENFPDALEGAHEEVDFTNERRSWKEGLRSSQAAFTVGYHLDDDLDALFSGGMSHYRNEVVVPFLPGITNFNNEVKYVTSTINYRNLLTDNDEIELKVYWNSVLMDMIAEIPGNDFDISFDTYNVDLQHTVPLTIDGLSHHLVYGFNYRHNRTTSDLFTADI